jgi:hypothetical protein
MATKSTKSERQGVDVSAKTPRSSSAAAGNDAKAVDDAGSSKKALTQDFTDEESCASLDELIEGATSDGMSEKAKELLLAVRARSFLSYGSAPTIGVDIRKIPDAVSDLKTLEEGRRFRATFARLIDQITVNGKMRPFGSICQKGPGDRFMAAVQKGIGLVQDTLAAKEDEEWSKADFKLFNEAAALQDMDASQFLLEKIHASVSKFNVMLYVSETHNYVDEFARNVLLGVFTAPERRRFIERSKGGMNENLDIESKYGMTNATASILDELESGEGNSTIYGVEAARKNLMLYRVPWGSFTSKNGIRKHLETYQSLYETFYECHYKMQLMPGFADLPGESRFFSLVRTICPPDSDYTSSSNFTKVAAQVTKFVGDALQFVYDSDGVPLSDDQRFEGLYQKLSSLDDGAKWNADPKAHQGNNSRGSILQAEETRSGKKNNELSGIDFDKVCRQHMHTGLCARGSGCKFVHLTPAQLAVFPVCTFKGGCTKGSSCRFRHSDDSINAVGALQGSGSAGKKAKSVLKQKPKKSRGEQLLLLRSADDLDDIDEGSGGEDEDE